MRLVRFSLWIFFLITTVVRPSMVVAQDYPNKPIRIVTTGVGGGNDVIVRLISPWLSASLGKQVIVDNRANSPIAAEVVSKAAPDGYSLLFTSSSFWIAPLMQNTSYDPVTEFSPISLVGSSPSILVVHPSLPTKSVKQLIELARAKPGALNYAAGTTGSANHLAAESFKAMTGVSIVNIPYKSTGPAIIDLMGGHVQLMFPTAASVLPHVKSGKLRALAVTSAEPSALAPGLPALAATVPGYDVVDAKAIFAPLHTPVAVITRLNQEILRALKRTEVQEKLFSTGTEAVGSSPGQLLASMKSEMARMGKLIKDAGIRVE